MVTKPKTIPAIDRLREKVARSEAAGKCEWCGEKNPTGQHITTMHLIIDVARLEILALRDLSLDTK